MNCKGVLFHRDNARTYNIGKITFEKKENKRIRLRKKTKNFHNVTVLQIIILRDLTTNSKVYRSNQIDEFLKHAKAGTALLMLCYFKH